MSTIEIEHCPYDVQKLWKVAEANGFTDFIYSSHLGLVAKRIPNSKRIYLSWGMFEKVSVLPIAHVSNGLEDEQDMNDFNHNPDASDKEITAAIQGKTILKCESIEQYGEKFLTFHFTDGTSLCIRYDWIYDWELVTKPL